jgi:predicted glycoside hydrolase/deacetylase ChbG (UPF0249 family)
MKIWVHADDFGLTDGVSEGIAEVYHRSPLNSISVMVNAYGLERAKELMRGMPGCRWAVHLNLVEGRPVSALPRESKLLQADGSLRNSLFSLARQYILSSPEARATLRREVRGEIAAQLRKAREEFAWSGPLHVDSHQHLHLLPFVFKALLETARENRVTYVRLPRGAFVWDASSWDNVRAPVTANMAKLTVYGALSDLHRPRLQAEGIASCDRIVSILHTGRMNAAAIRRELRAAEKGGAGTVEVLFHPAQPAPDEKSLWTGARLLRDYYFSSDRLAERNVLQDEMASIIEEFGQPQ